MTTKRQPVIVYEPNSVGGRLAYFAKAATSEYWDNLWDEREPVIDYELYEMGHLPRFLKKAFLGHVPPGSMILEAGCRTGWFTVAAKASGYNADAVDYAPRVVERLQERYLAIRWTVADVRSMPEIADATYDAIYSPGVCEHFREGPDPVLRESIRILKPGGHLLISTPCFNPFRRALQRMGAFKRPQAHTSVEFYQYAFSDREMRARCRSLGLAVVATVPHGTLHTLKSHMPFIERVLPTRLQYLVAGVLDELPGLRSWGHSCIWVARKMPVTDSPASNA